MPKAKTSDEKNRLINEYE